MKLATRRTAAFLLVILATAVLIPVTARAAEPASDAAGTRAKQGFPVDWSSHHVIVTGNNPSTALKAGLSDPRHVYNQVRHMVAVRNAKLERRRERDRE